jgi:hypothetical protein
MKRPPRPWLRIAGWTGYGAVTVALLVVGLLILATPPGTRNACAPCPPPGQNCPTFCSTASVPLPPSVWAFGVALVAGAAVLGLLAWRLRARWPVRRPRAAWP